MTRRPAPAATAAFLLAAAVLAGCGAKFDPVDCVPKSCLVTFDRGAPAGPVEVMGVSASLVSVEDKLVTADVSGHRLTFERKNQSARVGPLSISLKALTDTQVFLQLAQR